MCLFKISEQCISTFAKDYIKNCDSRREVRRHEIFVSPHTFLEWFLFRYIDPLLDSVICNFYSLNLLIFIFIAFSCADVRAIRLWGTRLYRSTGPPHWLPCFYCLTECANSKGYILTLTFQARNKWQI